MRTKIIVNRINVKKYSRFVLLMAVFIMLIVVYLYFDRRYAISLAIQSLGLLGVVIVILLMAIICITPIPSEGLVFLNLKIYGVYLGIFISWLGLSLSLLIIFVITRFFGQKLMLRIITPEHFHAVDNWVKRKGTLGLLIARLLPIPAVAINYIAGLIPSVEFWPYFWTGALSIIPYYVGTVLVFLGVSKGTWPWLILGSIAIFAFWSTSYVYKRRQLQ